MENNQNGNPAAETPIETKKAQSAVGIALQPVLLMLQRKNLEAAAVADALMEISAALVHPFGRDLFLQGAANAYDVLTAKLAAREEAKQKAEKSKLILTDQND